MENSKIKIIFIGTPQFGAIILDKFCQSEFKPFLVVTETDKPVGRKQAVTPPPVKIIAQNYNLPVEQPELLVNSKSQITNSKPDLIVVAAYGQILPKEILEIPKYGCLNIHPSLLPKYRGATPIQAAILSGDQETGVTIMLMDDQIDHGPILAQKKTVIGKNETAGQLHDRLAVLGAELLIDTIPDWAAGRIKLVEQDHKIATYTKLLTRDDGKIDWRKPAKEIEKQIRAFDPWPGTYTMHQKKRLKILKAKLENGKLIIEQVQPEGKKPMKFEDFLRGNKNFKLS